jgi:hypothetical protein
MCSSTEAPISPPVYLADWVACCKLVGLLPKHVPVAELSATLPNPMLSGLTVIPVC